ncbi:MAG: hypothetical protein KME45_30990 [Stenomitos rutilans HA7619-LM2]|jgi:tetratricopeptide (TPR) repeat protein|nr:hypothetical protein [Stenomitos rutilans HA7619-LM2]
MQGNSEDTRDRNKQRNLALEHYERGEIKFSINNERMQKEAIEEFRKLFAIVEIHHDPINSPFFSREDILPNAHKWCGLAHLKLWHKGVMDYLEKSCLEEAIDNFLSSAYYRSQASCKDNQSSKKWEEVKSYCNEYIEKYRKLASEKKDCAFFSVLISDCFNGLIGDVNPSTRQIEDAIMDLIITGSECESNDFKQEILILYAKLYEYRGYSYKQVKNFHEAKYDLGRACKIYDLIDCMLQDVLGTDEIIQAIRRTIEELDQELEDAKRKSAEPDVVEHHRRSGFFRNFAMYFLHWLTAIYGFSQMILLGVFNIVFSILSSIWFCFISILTHPAILASVINGLAESLKSFGKNENRK